ASECAFAAAIGSDDENDLAAAEREVKRPDGVAVIIGKSNLIQVNFLPLPVMGRSVEIECVGSKVEGGELVECNLGVQQGRQGADSPDHGGAQEKQGQCVGGGDSLIGPAKGVDEEEHEAHDGQQHDVGPVV